MTANTTNPFAALIAGAASGDAASQFSLAYVAITQKRGAPSPEDGERHLAAACAQDFPPALLFQAALTARGVGRSKDLDGAYALVRRAASLGSATAQDQLRILGADVLDRTPWLRPINLEPVAEAPRMFVVEEFIPAHVCDWLIQSAAKKGMKQAVVHTPDGRTAFNPARTNTMSGFLQTEGDLVAQLVSRRIARATGTPLANHEAMTVFRYVRGQEYKPHYDFIEPGTPQAENYTEELQVSGMRVATVLVYLNDGYEGGDTSFPRLGWQYKGKKGDALIFWSVSESGEPEKKSLHAGTPVLKGEKWLLSQWIRQRPFPLE